MPRISIATSLAALAIAAAPAAGARAAACQQSWEVVPSPNPGNKGDNVLKAVAGLVGNDIWAVGQYAPDSNPNVLQTLVAHFDGTAWRQVPSPDLGSQANSLQALAVTTDGAAWAVGYAIDDRSFFARSLIEAWNGSAWRIVPHPDPGAAAHLFAVSADAADDVWAVGETEPRIGQSRTLTLHYDGTAWSVVQSPNPGNTGNILYGVGAFAANDAWAVGAQTDAPGPDRALILHWDGSVWHSVATPADGASTTALYAVTRGVGGLVAVGEAQNDIAGRTLALVEGGLRLAREPIQATALGDDHLYGVAATATGDWAVGSSIDWNAPGGGVPRNLVERRDGAAGPWRIVASPDPAPGGENQLGGVAEIGGTVWVVGDHDGPRALRTFIMRSCR